MQKSKAERERLIINARAQHVLSGKYIHEPPKTGTVTLAPRTEKGFTQKVARKVENQSQTPSSKDVYQPTGEIDYSRFNKAKK